MATIVLCHQKVKFMYSANLLLGKRMLLPTLFFLCLVGLSGATSAFVGTTPAGNVAETQTSEPPKNSGGGELVGVFDSSRSLAQDWRQYAVRDELKPELQTPGRIVLERTPLRHDPTPLLLLTLQADNIQVRETWQVSNAIHVFDINNDGELYLTVYLNEAATLVATVYLIDEFQILNAAYQNLTASAVITVEVMLGDLSAEQPPRLEVVEGVAEEVYVFDAHGGTRPHIYTLLENPDDNAFVFSNGTLSVNVSATIDEYRFTVEVADAGNMLVTVVATVSVGAAATIQVAGGGAVFVVQGQEKVVSDGEAISFNPRSQSGVMVSVKVSATVALTAPDDAWQITLYGDGEAFFAGVAEAGSDDVVVGVSLVGDSDFVRNTDEKIVLAYVFSDEVIVPVEPQGTRIFCRSYGGLWYLVIDEGVANLPQGRSNYVNFLAFGDGRWNLNGSPFKEEEPFTLDDFMVTVAYRYAGEVGEVQANDGVAPSFSLVGDTEVFALTMWSGLRYDQWLPGLLAIIEGQEGPLTLSVTVAAEDHLGDMLGYYGYVNRMATVTAVVQVESLPPLVLSASEARAGIVGYKDVLLSFTADGGALPYTYSIVASNDSGYFDITDIGELSVLEDAVAGIYTLSIVLRDSEHQSATVAVTVTVTIQDIQEGASRIFVLGGYDNNNNVLNDVWFSVDGKNWVLETDDAVWARRRQHQALSHNGRLYVLGGEDNNFSILNDAWSSADGKNWVLETDDAEWARRSSHQALSHNGRLYVLGGENSRGNGGLLNDVWYLADGQNWVLETDDAEWARRTGHQALSHNGRLYVLGGYGGDLLNDVWSSADGQNWSLETDDAEWADRYEHQALSHNGRLYVLGGQGKGEAFINDVWSSADGKNWSLETGGAEWPHRTEHQALSYNGRLYVLGGLVYGFNRLNDVWSSADGKNWSLETDDANWPGRDEHQAVVFTPEAVAGADNMSVTVAATVEIKDSRIFVMGGPNENYTYLRNVWSSADSKVWSLETGTAGWSGREEHQALSHNGRIYVLGGGVNVWDRNAIVKNDVWSSVDGKTWTQETVAADWSPRALHQALSHNGRIYVLGGSRGEYGEYKNDVWSSADGQNWSLETDDADWSVRSGHQALSHKGRIYVLGGLYVYGGDGPDSGSNTKNDVWSSEDGKTWMLETGNANWPARDLHQALSYKGRIYVLGGVSGGDSDNEESLNDVWSSADGQTWTLETDDADWPVRENYQALSYNGRIYVLGGFYYDEEGDNDDLRNDVWSSVDGQTWRLETNSANWSKRFDLQAVVFPPEAE